MRILPKSHTIRKSLLLYRKIRYRRGHGVHSPFVFKLITRVIEEKSAYYSYDDIALIRKKLYYSKEQVVIPEKGNNGKVHIKTVDSLIRKFDLPAKEGELLFRLANYFKPTHVLQIAPSDIFSSFYLSFYSEKTTCHVLQNRKPLLALSEKIFPAICPDSVTVEEGEYEKGFSGIMKEIPRLDFIYLDQIAEQDKLNTLWENLLTYKSEHTVFIIRGIHKNRPKRMFWKKICNDPEATVTLDLYKYGIVLFNKKFHKRTYKVYF